MGGGGGRRGRERERERDLVNNITAIFLHCGSVNVCVYVYMCGCECVCIIIVITMNDGIKLIQYQEDMLPHPLKQITNSNGMSQILYCRLHCDITDTPSPHISMI